MGTQQVVPSETSHTHLLLKGDRLKRLSVVRFHVICVVLRHVQKKQREFTVCEKQTDESISELAEHTALFRRWYKKLPLFTWFVRKWVNLLRGVFLTTGC